jgi:hypothetical protein
MSWDNPTAGGGWETSQNMTSENTQDDWNTKQVMAHKVTDPIVDNTFKNAGEPSGDFSTNGGFKSTSGDVDAGNAFNTAAGEFASGGAFDTGAGDYSNGDLGGGRRDDRGCFNCGESGYELGLFSRAYAFDND